MLRFWETEFPFLKPTKSKSGQRVYQEPQLNLIRRIKELLYDEEYTIAGAKKKLEAEIEAGQLKVAPEEPEKKPPASRKTTSKKKTAARRGATRGATNAKSAKAHAADGQNGQEEAREEAANEQAEKVGALRDGIRQAIDQCEEILTRLQA